MIEQDYKGTYLPTWGAKYASNFGQQKMCVVSLYVSQVIGIMIDWFSDKYDVSGL